MVGEYVLCEIVFFDLFQIHSQIAMSVLLLLYHNPQAGSTVYWTIFHGMKQQMLKNLDMKSGSTMMVYWLEVIFQKG